MMRIVWHGNYYRYFELARTAFQKSLHMDWPDLVRDEISMPIVKSSADYRVALAYGDAIRIRVHCPDVFAPALDLAYEIREAGGTKLYARGATRQVYVEARAQEMLFAVPPSIEERMRRALDALAGLALSARGPQ